MAEDATQEQPVEAQGPHGEPDKPEIDWKATSRKWEQRAKENKNAAEELAALKQSQMSEQEKTQAQLAEAQKKLESYQTAEKLSAWKTQVSKDSGIPADLLRGNTLEEIQEHAESVKSYLDTQQSKPFAQPVVLAERSNAANGKTLPLNGSPIEESLKVALGLH